MTDNKYFELNESGMHHLGGRKPNELIIPEHNFEGGIQYLGYIDKHDACFNWLPESIHLICPIYINWVEVYFDYSNALAPLLINKESYDAESNFEELNIDSEIIFSKHNFITSDHNLMDLEIGNTLNPDENYVKNSFWPECPISMTKMRFLCRIYGSSKIISNFMNIKFEDEFNKSFFNSLACFGNDGELLVFINPDTKIVCYYIND